MGERWKNIVGAIGIALLLTLGITTFGKTAISDIAGLAVAQTSTLWNNVRDAAVGDNITNGLMAMSLYLYDGSSAFNRVRGDTTNGMDVDVTRMPGGAQTPADAFANPSTFQGTWSLNGIFNGTTWDRVREANASTLTATGVQAIVPYGLDGSSLARMNMLSTTNNTATTSTGAIYAVPLSTWNITNSANAGTPTISRAAGGGTVRHVTTALSVCVGAAGTAQPVVQVNLRDGATGAGTIVRSWQLAAVINSNACITENGLNITGSANTAMTLEFAAATAAATQATVNLSGYSTP